MSGWSLALASFLQDIMESIPTFKFAFVFFMVTSSWTLLSILTAVASQRQGTKPGGPSHPPENLHHHHGDPMIAAIRLCVLSCASGQREHDLHDLQSREGLAVLRRLHLPHPTIHDNTCIHTHTPTCTPTHPTHIDRYTYAHIQTGRQAGRWTDRKIHIIYIYIYIYIYIDIYIYILIYIYTYIHTHISLCVCACQYI